jgi:predicted neuraminidase
MLLLVGGGASAFAQDAARHAEIVMPYQNEHVHGSTLEELPNGDLLVAWFQGSGERWADDVRILGARKKYGSDTWSPPFVMADVDGFPDVNPVLFVDGQDRLWLLWYTVIANQWSTSLLKYRISDDYATPLGAPKWTWQTDLHVKPGDKAERGIQPGDAFVQSVEQQLEAYREQVSPANEERYARWRAETLRKARGEDMIREGRIYDQDGSYEEAELGYPYFRRMGWQTRSKPVVTRSGRMIVPLYSDGFSFSLMAYTDDGGKTWQFSEPLVGAGNIQPAIAQTADGELVAYMRDNGPAPKRLHVSRSTDEGETWSPVEDSDLPNPGAAADIVTLESGDWVLIYNDTEDGRHRLAVALSEDGGQTWPWKRHLERDESSAPRTAHYPAIIQGRDGTLHASYSYHLPQQGGAERKTIKYATFSPSWIKAE